MLGAHLTKVALKHTTHNPVIEHIGKESVRQVGRRARRETLRLTKHGKQSQSPKSAHGFTPRSPRVSSARTARASGRTNAYMARGGKGGGFGAGGYSGGFGGFHGK